MREHIVAERPALVDQAEAQSAGSHQGVPPALHAAHVAKLSCRRPTSGSALPGHILSERGLGGAVLAADADLELLARAAAALDADPHQLANALAIDRHERIGRQDAARRVGAEEARRIVTADAERRLREVVGAEREELRRLCD